ncbi:MAG: ABC transporter permease [Planctomycetes bacterium]|nr:ABC transporter permease [Planctomycetota bacterium]
MTLVRNFDAATANRSAFTYFGSLLRYPAVVWRNRFMVQNFLRRDLMNRVNGSVLGIGWILLQPLFLFAIYFLVFGVLMRDRNLTSQDTMLFAVYLFSGVVVFHSLTEATTQACTTIVDNGNLVKKVAFPSEALLVHIATTSVVIYLVGAFVVLVAGFSFGVLAPTWNMLAWPLVVLVQFTLTLGIGLLLANLYVFVRDVGQLWRLLTMAWMFLSPVFWDRSLLGKDHPEVVQWVAVLNPAFSLLEVHRLALGLPADRFGPFWSQLGIAAAWAFGFLVVGYTVFMSRKHRYSDLI